MKALSFGAISEVPRHEQMKKQFAAICVSICLATIASAAHSLTLAQMNAVRSAKDYLNMSGFSRRGLIDQLSSPYGEGFSIQNATAAVNSMSVDWNQQAVRSARDYLNMSSFSCRGLIEQLSSDYGEKYTVSQATYAANRMGIC